MSQLMKNQKSPKLQNPNVFCCPVENCRKSKMPNVQAINIHLKKKHPDLRYKIVQTLEGLPIVRMT